MNEKEKFKPYAAAYLVLIKDGQVLLLRRFNTGYQDGKYSLVAGHLEGGETTSQCIIREAYEEAGIVLCAKDLKVAHIMHRLTPTREYFDFYIQAKKWTGNITNMEPDKSDGLNWYNTDNLPSNILPEVKYALKNINENLYYSEYGWPDKSF